jgi:ABC-type sugar transport system permease subunit
LLILLIVFVLYPVLSNFIYSITNWKGAGDMQIIGPDNYHNMPEDETFRISIKNTALFSVGNIFVVWVKPGFRTYTPEYEIYDAGFVGFIAGYASARAVILFIFCSMDLI